MATGLLPQLYFTDKIYTFLPVNALLSQSRHVDQGRFCFLNANSYFSPSALGWKAAQHLFKTPCSGMPQVRLCAIRREHGRQIGMKCMMDGYDDACLLTIDHGL